MTDSTQTENASLGCTVEPFVATYTVSVHEGEDIIRHGHDYRPGWIRVEEEVPHMGLREVIRTLREEGYADEAILVESECANVPAHIQGRSEAEDM